MAKHEYYTQCNLIGSLFGYQLLSKDFDPLLYKQAEIIIQRDTNPQFIVMELLAFLREKKIIYCFYRSSSV
jgi:hypothetical protein